jgi:hypothetical protein
MMCLLTKIAPEDAITLQDKQQGMRQHSQLLHTVAQLTKAGNKFYRSSMSWCTAK